MSEQEKQVPELSIRKANGARPYPGKEGDPRGTPIDYSKFPRGLSYVSVGDVDAAYKQGRADQASLAAGTLAERDETIRRMVEQIAELRADLAAPVAAVAMRDHVELELTSATTNGHLSNWD